MRMFEPLAKEEVVFAGQPIAVVVAETEAAAEDGVAGRPGRLRAAPARGRHGSRRWRSPRRSPGRTATTARRTARWPPPRSGRPRRRQRRRRRGRDRRHRRCRGLCLASRRRGWWRGPAEADRGALPERHRPPLAPARRRRRCARRIRRARRGPVRDRLGLPGLPRATCGDRPGPTRSAAPRRRAAAPRASSTRARSSPSIFGLPVTQVRSIGTPLGGAFGAKILVVEPLAAGASLALKRPVRLALTGARTSR